MTSLRENIRDQVLHFVVFGLVAVLDPALAVAAVAVYELSSLRWNVGKLTIGQWPPGRPEILVGQKGPEVPTTRTRITQMDRVEDLRLDLVVSFAGIVVGSIGQKLWIAKLAGLV